MVTARRLVATLGLASALALVGCAHGQRRTPPPSASAQRFATEATQIRAIQFEEDFLDARLVYQALPVGSPARAQLREKLFQYLLAPVARLDPARLRRDPAYLGSAEEVDRLFECFRDALDLIAPSEIWQPSLGISPTERDLLTRSAHLVVRTYSPRGNETAVAVGLYVLASLEPKVPIWPARIAELFAWLESGNELGVAGNGLRDPSTPGEVLESVAALWPSPLVAERVTKTVQARQTRLGQALRRPANTGSARRLLGEFLFEGEGLQSMGVTMAAPYLRAGRLVEAQKALAGMAGSPGDDDVLRRLVKDAIERGKPDDFAALARRYLPRVAPLGGTSGDRIDLGVAAEVLRLGLAQHPNHAGLLVLASQVTRLQPAPFLALRYLEEASVTLERASNAALLAEVTAERLELSFTRLRVRIDPEHMEPAAREAELLRRQIAESRQRFGATRLRFRDSDIDFEMGRGFVDAGLVDRAEPLLLRARTGNEAGVETSLQLANLFAKRGDPARAATILRDALDRHRRGASVEETIPFVEGQSKLARALGNAYEASGNAEEARRAWRLSRAGWERLMVEFLRRKNLGASAEATLEVGRLDYQLGRREEGLQKFSEAIEQNENRDQSYIDALSFLVQRGETEAALDIYRRLISRPSGAEYVKVYTSIWMLDLSRRSLGTPDSVAEGYLKALDAREVHLRPARASAWYIQLARFALGRISYEALLGQADTPGKKAEVYFYEAMHRLANGKRDDAHDLWNKVLQTKMVSFFEYEMAARYLRTGAPSQPRPTDATQTI